MKAINNLIYLVYSISVLGLFAAIAQNDYGVILINFCNGILSLLLFMKFSMLMKELFRDKKTTTIVPGFLLLITVLFVMSANGIIPVSDSTLDILLMIFAILSLGFIIYSNVINRKQIEPRKETQAIELLGMLLFLTGYFFKMSFRIRASGPLLVIGAGILVLIYIPFAFRLLLNYFRKGKMAAFLGFVFYLAISAATLTFVFKTMHWPGGSALCYLFLISLVFIIVPLLLNRKIYFDTEKKEFHQLLFINKRITSFVFLYFAVFNMILFLQFLGINFNVYSYSNPPKYQQMRDLPDSEEKDLKMGAYWDNYDNFRNKRIEALNKNQ